MRVIILLWHLPGPHCEMVFFMALDVELRLGCVRLLPGSHLGTREDFA